MKKIFRKAMTIAGSVALVGSSVGAAFAASYPSPFTSNTAIVVGANAAPSDNIAAGSIASDLDAMSAGDTVTTVEGGESFDLYDSDYLYFGDAMNAVVEDLDEAQMSSALASGDYDSGEIDVGYDQMIVLGNQALELIVSEDLNDEEPTFGYWFDDKEVMTYNLTFDDGVQMIETSSGAADGMEGTDFPLFGREYYVLDVDVSSAGNEEITLLNSAEKAVVSEGSSIEVDGHTVSIEYITDTDVKFSVDGESTSKLQEGEYDDLDDGYYIVLTTNLYESKDTGVSKAEFSLGSGRVILTNGDNVETTDSDDDLETVDELTTVFDITGTGTSAVLNEIELTWTTDDEEFLTEEEALVMPVFEEFGFTFGGLMFGDTTEEISLDKGDVLTLNMGNFDIELMYNSSSEQYLGGDGTKLLLNGTSGTSKTFAIAKDERFLATLLDNDLADVDQAYFELKSLNNDSDEFDLDFGNLIDSAKDMKFTDASAGDDDDLGDINIQIDAVYEEDQDVANTYNATADSRFSGYTNGTNNKALVDFAVITVSADSTLYFDRVVSEEGMVVILPTTAGEGQIIEFYEAADDGDVITTFDGSDFNLTTDYDASDEELYAKVSSTGNAGLTMVDETTDDKTVGYVESIHATKVMEDSDENTLEIEYYKDEVYADLKIFAGGEVSTSTEEGVMTVTDANVASVAGKNLVVVGGSAINSVAADLLGGAYREADFTAETGVAAGEFLIQSFDRSGKTALLVAGYNAADTEKAVEYLLNNDVDTSVGTKMKGTSATEATLVTA